MYTNTPKGLITLPLLILMSSLPLTLHASSPHVHGLANIFVAIDQQQVVVEVESPSGNILGFEHVPHNEQQKQRLKAALATLQSHQSLIDFEDANCQQVSMTLENPLERETTHGKQRDEHEHHDEHKHHDKKHKKGNHDEHEHHDEHKHHDKHEHHEEHKHTNNTDTHSEFHISYTLQCEKIAHTASITAYDSFSGFESIQINWLTPEKQGSNKTSIHQRQVQFK